jgi:mono/diheme cytochrome c family protein
MNDFLRMVKYSAWLLAAALSFWGPATLPGQARPARPAAGGGQTSEVPTPPRPRRNSFLISRDVPDTAAVERGKKVFVASCGFCHGPSATGGENGPDLVRSVVALRDEGGDLIGPIIRQGVPYKGMPPLPMSDEQISDIAAFIRGRQQAAINRGDYEIQSVVTGNAEKGKAYVNGAGGCNDCHSPSGDLAGIASKFEPVDLQQRFMFPGPRRFGPATSAPPPTKVTVTPSGKPAVSGTLDYIDDFNVALWNSAGTYHSFTRTKDMKVDVRDPLQGHIDLLSKYTDDDMHNVLTYLVTLK